MLRGISYVVKNTFFRLLAGLGGRRGVVMARLLFQLFVLDPLSLISAYQAARRWANPPMGAFAAVSYAV